MTAHTAQGGVAGTVSAPADRSLASTEELLVSGGDARTALIPELDVNRYGCAPHPDPGLVGFGSSTASTISPQAFAAAQALRDRLAAALSGDLPEVVYRREMQSVRGQLIDLCDLGGLADLDIVFGASGTDLHRIAVQMTGAGRAYTPVTAITVDTGETGSGVPSSLAAVASDSARNRAGAVAAIEPARALSPVLPVAIRSADGAPRDPGDIDAEVEVLARRAIACGHRVLIVIADVSKTGLVAPTPACAKALRRHYPDRVDVLVDACQFRLSPATLRDYLAFDFPVAVTGSKFLGGPTFAGALLVPPALTGRFQQWRPPPLLTRTCAGADWPESWAAAMMPAPAANFGLLLRWRAALVELRRLRTVPDRFAAGIARDFATAVTARLTRSPLLQPLPPGDLSRPGLPPRTTFDRIQTIFPFAVQGADGRPCALLDADQARSLQRAVQRDLYGHTAGNGIDPVLAAERYQLGQPATIGADPEKSFQTLRLCLGARSIVEAAAGPGAAQRIIRLALRAITKTEALLYHGHHR